MFVFNKIKWFCAFTKYTTKIYNKATIHVGKLTLTPFSPIDIKWEILNLIWKASGNVMYVMGSLILFRVFVDFVDHVTVFSSSSMQHLRWSKWLETVVGSCYIELFLKYERAPRPDTEMYRSV